MNLYEIENMFYRKISEIENYYLGKYPNAEQKSFDFKVQEASLFLSSLNPNDCPIILQELKLLYSRDPTQQEIIDRCNVILHKKSIFSNTAAKISGLRQIFEQDPYNFDFNLFEVYFPEVFGTST
ncbi:MAG: hypothetical protein QW474_03650 [Candidatus Aenigmatarchaeota archaeon]